MKTLLSFLCLSLLGLNLYAQTAEDKLGTWLTIRASHKLNKDWSLGGVAELRQYEFVNNLNFFYLQGYATYKLSPKFSLTGGYLFGILDTTFEAPDKNNVIEHRVLEQVNFKHKLNELSVAHRARLEQRFWNANSSEIRHRFRYRLKFSQPISKSIYGFFYDELILRKEVKVFEQNVICVGTGFKINAHIAVECAYLQHKFLSRNLDRLQFSLVLK